MSLRSVPALFAFVILVAGPMAQAPAAELLMLERQGCVWCKRFDAEIAPIYPKTDEALKAPLRRVDIDAPWPADLAGIEPDRFTPTFVLVENGKEIARVRGYPGEEFFWFRIDEMLEKLADS